jgi:hypothetical protein
MLHWIGVFFIFAASILLLITTISAPVIHDIALLKVTLTNQSSLRYSSVTFGTFGHCVLDVAGPTYVPPAARRPAPPDPELTRAASDDQDWCAPSTVGYSPASIMNAIDGTGFSVAASATADGLTNAMILHPIACGLAFIAFLLALGAGVIGSLLGALVAALAWVLTLIVMAIDFTLFGVGVLARRWHGWVGADGRACRSSRTMSTTTGAGRMPCTAWPCGPSWPP